MQGNVYWVDFQDAGRHLHLAVAEDHLNRGETVLVVPFTSQSFARRRQLPTSVEFDANSGYNFIGKECVAQAEMIFRIERGELHELAGTISEDDMNRLRDALACVFGPRMPD